MFFFNDTATTEIYTLSLHDALPILVRILKAGFGLIVTILAIVLGLQVVFGISPGELWVEIGQLPQEDRKSTRLNSSHANISYAVFCLKKKTKKPHPSKSNETISLNH